MDLSTTYCGLKLKNPIVPSASPVSQKVDGLRRLEDAGAGAVVLFSIFEEQIHHDAEALDHLLTAGTESFGEALSYFPAASNYRVGPEAYLDLVAEASRACEIPVIGSLNGVSSEGWVDYARKIQDAGAKAIELNVYYIPTDPQMSGAEVEQMYIDVLREVRQNVTIPVAIKLGPYFSSTAHVARRLAEAGADALVLFNRFYQPDFDLEKLDVAPTLNLSSSAELRLPLTWVAVLYGRIPVDLAITGGIHAHEDVLKAVMAGANITQMASELLQRGCGRIKEIVESIRAWMEEYEYESITQMRGSMSQIHVAEPSAFERANYARILQTWRQDPTGKRL